MIEVTECDRCGRRVELTVDGDIRYAVCGCGHKIAFSAVDGKDVPFPKGVVG